jgi:pentachlorophenol monooxygenase
MRHEEHEMGELLDALVVGAGPVGLTLASELRRRGVECRIIDRLDEPSPACKAVGIQPRTLEVWEDMGCLREALDAGVWLRGQIIYANGGEPMQMELDPSGMPYGFFALPQFEVERVLTAHLAGLGTRIERGVELQAFADRGDRVEVTLGTPGGGTEALACRYLAGCDGAHSAVRRGLGLSFEGDKFAEEFMLGDVAVEWSLPRGYTVRVVRKVEGGPDDILVCIPLPGRDRYRVSMLVAPDLARPAGDAPVDPIEHGFVTGRPMPTLAHLQGVVDRLAPPGTVLSDLRWSSIFGISHRIVDRYSRGRVFVCGDAAHIHPPTGAQGANTGMQDAYNLAWKLALVVQGSAGTGLLETYDAERRPVGEEVVGRTVQHARTQFGDVEQDPRNVLLREAQLLVGYPDSPIVGEVETGDSGDGAGGGPRPGERAPDAVGLVRERVQHPLRVFDLTRGTDHVLLLSATSGATAADVRELEAVAEAAMASFPAGLRAYAILDPDVPDPDSAWLPALRDAEGTFRAAYGVTGTAAYLIRPDGYVGFRALPASRDAVGALGTLLSPGRPTPAS